MAIGAAIVGLSVTSGVLDIYSQISASQEQKSTSKYNQAILDSNQRINDAMTDFDIRRIREEGEGILGEQLAARGKSGTTFSGSNIDVFMDSVRNMELDVIAMELGKTTSAASTAQRKSILASQAENAQKAYVTGLVGTAVNAASKISASKANSIAQTQSINEGA